MRHPLLTSHPLKALHRGAFLTIVGIRCFTKEYNSFVPLENMNNNPFVTIVAERALTLSVYFQKTMYGANVIIFEGILIFAHKELIEVSTCALCLVVHAFMKLIHCLLED